MVSIKPKLKLDFCDFWPGFDKVDNFFVRSLRTRFDVVICDRPDILIYSDKGHHHRLYPCRRVFYTVESLYPDYAACDYAMTPFYLDGDARHCRVPYYVLLGDPAALLKTNDDPEAILRGKSRFCSFVTAQDHGRKTANRVAFFEKLNAVKRVESGGRILNNVGGSIGPAREDKLDFLRATKFNICFENAALPGYTTEKLYDAMEARCIPVYWGNPRVGEEFNPKSFLNVADYPSFDEVIEAILELDRDEDRFLDMMREPFFHEDRINQWFSAGRICDFFERIASDSSQPVGARRSWFQIDRWIAVKKDKPY